MEKGPPGGRPFFQRSRRSALLLVAARHGAFHALDVEVDAREELVVGDHVLGEQFLAVLAEDRALPDRERTVLQAGLDLVHLGLGLGGHVVGDGDEVDRAFLHAPPALAGGPRAFQHVARGLDVVRAPVDDGRAQVGLGAVGGHVAIPAESALALFLGGLEHGGRIGVLEQHVGAAVDQRGGGLGFLRRAEPFVHPHHLGLDLRVDRLRAQREAVDVADHLGDRHRTDHAQRVGLGHGAGDHAGHVGAFVGAAVVGAHVGRGLVAGGMLELHVREIGGDLLDRLHVAEGGAEDQLVALAGHVAQHALGIGRFGHALDEAGDDLVAEFLLDGLAAVVVRERPAAVAHRADVGERDLQRLGLGRGGRGGGRGCRRGCRRRLVLLAAARERGGGQGGKRGGLHQRALVQIGHVECPSRGNR